MDLKIKDLQKQIKQHQNPARAKSNLWFFKTGKGEYGEGDANTYYYYALAYNKIKDWDKAIISANKALEIEKDEKDAKAKIYFELGTAYYGKGDTSEACKAYKDAAYGDYVAQANYQLKEVLKCQ